MKRGSPNIPLVEEQTLLTKGTALLSNYRTGNLAPAQAVSSVEFGYVSFRVFSEIFRKNLNCAIGKI